VAAHNIADPSSGPVACSRGSPEVLHPEQDRQKSYHRQYPVQQEGGPKAVRPGRQAAKQRSGKVADANFRNFELKVDVLAKNNSNGGIYFHTAYQETGWPDKGFEVQVNNTFNRDPRKTGGLYGVSDNLVPPAKDDEWFTEHIVVRGNSVKIYVNEDLVTNWVQPDDWDGLRPLSNGRGQNFPLRKLDTGTFALQGHDPGSVVMYKNIRVKLLD